MRFDDNLIKILEQMLSLEYQMRCQEIDEHVSENMIMTILSLYDYFMQNGICASHIPSDALLEVFSLTFKIADSKTEQYKQVQKDVMNRLEKISQSMFFDRNMCH